MVFLKHVHQTIINFNVVIHYIGFKLHESLFPSFQKQISRHTHCNTENVKEKYNLRSRVRKLFVFTYLRG